MQRNFQLGQSNEILISGRAFDLHNDYIPVAVVIDIQSCAVQIEFLKIAQEDFQRHCALVFDAVDALEIRGNICAGADSGLGEMGFKAADDYDYEWLSGERQSAAGDHFVVRFDDGTTMRIHGERAHFVVDPIRPFCLRGSE